MHIPHDLRQKYPYSASPTGTGWRVIDRKAKGCAFVSEEYDDREDALSHIKVLNEAYWLEQEAEYLTRAVIWKALEQSAPPLSSSGHSLLWTLLKALLRTILFVKKVLGITGNHKSISSQPNENITKYFEWKRITLEDIDRLWRKSGKLDAPFREQLSHFAHGLESILKSNVPDEYRLYWQSITQDYIDKQWQESKTVHPAFGRQICHFASGIERIVVNANSK